MPGLKTGPGVFHELVNRQGERNMKTFMISGALIILLMFFPLQWVLGMYNTNLRENVDLIVDKYAQNARIEGRFTPEAITRLINEIHVKTDIPIDEIVVHATTIPKYRNDMFNEQEFLNYDIRVPIKHILAIPWYFNITDAENQTFYARVGSVASEVLAP